MKKGLTLLLFAGIFVCNAQIGGRSVYQFLNLVPSARVAAQGGNAIANTENDLNFALWNPSLLRPEMSGQVSVSMVDYMSDIVLGDVSYAYHHEKAGTFMLDLRYLNYGDFDRTNVVGQKLGEFTATDMSVAVGYSYHLDSNWSFGGNLKYINSNLDTYTSNGAAVDLAATYHIPDKRVTIALVAKNLGFQFTPYDQQRENLPFELQLGFSNRLEHLPLRWQITLEQLETFDLRYDDPNDRQVNQLTGEVEENSPSMLNNLMRHVVLGAEFAPAEFLNFQVGLAARRRQELTLDTRRTGAGWSFGIGIKISKFKINYGRSNFHVAGGANHFSIITDLGSFKKS